MKILSSIEFICIEVMIRLLEYTGTVSVSLIAIACLERGSEFDIIFF